MKKTLIIPVLLSMITLSAQVGMDTTSPQQKLHVSGAVSNTPTSDGVIEPTIRIDGLSEVNNAGYVASARIQPLFVNKDGDLTLNDKNATYGYKAGNNLPDDDLPTVVRAVYNETGSVDYQTQVATIGDIVETVIKDINFTLDAKSLVSFYSSLSMEFRLLNGKIVNDNTSLHAALNTEIGYRIVNSPNNDFDGMYIAFGVYSYNGDNSYPISGPITKGFLRYSNNEEIILPSGTYDVELVSRQLGALYMHGEIDGTSYYIDFGIDDNDRISIIAKPWLY